MHTRRYALWGALFGLTFPVVASLLQAALDPITGGFLERALRAQAMPLMWIVDTAPIVLGLFAAMAGRLEDRRLSAEVASRRAFNDTSRELFRAAQKLLSTVSSFSALTAQTAASVRETHATMGQMAQTAAQAALTAETVVGMAESSARTSEDGLRAVENVTGEMLQLAEDVRDLSTRIEGLNARMRDVFEIASVVDSVSERSQALAAHAAREVEQNPAARSFAPIVAEMRQHAEDARRSAQNVKRLLGEGHKAMLAAMTAAERGIQRAERGADVARTTGSTIQRLATALRDSSRAARDIAQVAQQQDNGVDEMRKALNEIFLATEETVVGTREVAGGAHTLTELAERLQKALQQGR
jgi:methyl-accepting chemotaxis protein